MVTSERTGVTVITPLTSVDVVSPPLPKASQAFGVAGGTDVAPGPGRIFEIAKTPVSHSVHGGKPATVPHEGVILIEFTTAALFRMSDVILIYGDGPVAVEPTCPN